MNLAELQQAFQQHVLHGDGAIADSVNATAQVPVAIRLGIYAEAYRLRLIDALAHNYPRLQQLLDHEAFTTLALRYLEDYPSTSVSVRWFGDRLAMELGKDASRPWLTDLATWEWTIAAAFDAADAEPVSEAALAEIDPGAWPALRFAFHPSLRRVELRTNAVAMFRALSDEVAGPTPAELESPQAWLVWRHALTTRYRPLAAEETQALDVMCDGGTFEQLCEALCEWHDAAEVPVNAAMLLKGWIGEGLVVAVTAQD